MLKKVRKNDVNAEPQGLNCMLRFFTHTLRGMSVGGDWISVAFHTYVCVLIIRIYLSVSLVDSFHHQGGRTIFEPRLSDELAVLLVALTG